MPEEQNVLSRRPGETVAVASQTLPPAATCEDAFREVEIDVPILGFTVRIRFVRYLQKWRKERRWFWLSDSAVRVED